MAHYDETGQEIWD